ncbi:hypothetical protein [Tahibacter caeni]|nr:hypothetical protein [Tahibacter caeni]
MATDPAVDTALFRRALAVCTELVHATVEIEHLAPRPYADAPLAD